MGKFVHLHSHTEYSLLDGLSRIKKIAKRTKELGMDAIAITDHGSMYGAVEFYNACKANEVKPIIGCEMYVAPRSHKNKEGKIDTEPYHLTVLAKNYQGYLNLLKLVSIAQIDGFYYKPRIDKDLLREYHEGLICLSACPGGEFIRALDRDPKQAEEVAKTYLEIFGEGNYFFELQNHHYDELLKNPNLDSIAKEDLTNMDRLQKLTFQAIKEMSPKLGIPMVATNDFHYINEEDAEAQDALVCVATGKFISDTNRLRMVTTPNLYLKSPEEMAISFKDLPQALETSVKIAEMVDLEIPQGVAKFPIFEPPKGKTPMEYLRDLTYEMAPLRMEVTDAVRERLDYELSVIEKKNYPTYFLIVQDFMNWAHDQKIITNTRGSAAGSLVLYALGVTSVNPLTYMLPFERFLNPFRPSLPDIDADMADDRREDIIRYVMDKYGHDKVAHIVTFGTMMGRAAIRDIGRVLGIPYGEVDAIAKLVPPPHQGFHKPLVDAIKEVPELSISYKTNPSVKKLLDLAMKVEGSVRHASVHAAGIVIAPEPITNFVPLQKESNGDKVVSQYDMFASEAVGLVKMDFLGIRNLSILGRSVEYVKENRNIDVDLSAIDLEDKKTYELLGRGETMGLFQLEGGGMTKYLMELRPTNIFDISAMLALYRPGPISVIPEYIARKHDPSKITYFLPEMKDYLERSLGLLVYQDDVLMTAINIAGYNWEEADKFRKAMGKKIPEEMAKQKDHFIEGAMANKGLTKDKAEELFKLIEPFAAYGFNKAHAASYSMISYQTAFMKANYPVEFMTALMTAEHGDTEKIARAMDECKRMGIVVLPPDVNRSQVGFSVERLTEDSLPIDADEQLKSKIGQDAIRFGLSAIKNVGVNAIEAILSARAKKTFDHIQDLCMRVDTRLANRKTIESLIKAGALDQFGTRAAQLSVMEECLEDAHKVGKNQSIGQESLFGEEVEIKIQSAHFLLPHMEELPLDQLLVHEKELLGFYLHEPPYAESLRQLGDYISIKAVDLSSEDIGSKKTFGGVILEAKKIITKKSGAEMAFIRFFDGTGELEAVVFPKLYTEVKDILVKEEVLLMDGKIDNRDDKLSIIIERVERFDPEYSQKHTRALIAELDGGRTYTRRVDINVPEDAGAEVLQQVNSTLRQFPGDASVTVILASKGGVRRLNLNIKVNPGTEFKRSIESLLGSETVFVN